MRNTIVKKEQLKELLQKYLNGEASNEEKQKIEAWYDQFDQEEVPEEIINRANDPKLKDRVFNQITSTTKPAMGKTRRLPVFWYWAAAIALLAMISYALWLNQPAGTSQWQQKLTQAGQKSTFTLPDGSVIYLNANSQLSFPEQFSAGRRLVKLDGEAFFEVTHNPESPFIVLTDSIQTTVLGTSFNINTYDNQNISVTVATGRVSVGKQDAKHPWAELMPNQQLTYLPESDQYQVKQVAVADWTSWKDGKLNLADRDLSEVLPELERWYGITIVLRNQALGNCQFQTELRDQSLQSLLEEFAFAADVHYEITKDTVFLQGKGCN